MLTRFLYDIRYSAILSRYNCRFFLTYNGHEFTIN